MDNKPRRGWRERIESGLYRAHRVGCPRSGDHRAGGRCTCPYQFKAPGAAPGTTRTVSHPGPVIEARAERRRLMAAGRPAPEESMVEAGTVDDLATAYLRTRQGVLAPNTVRIIDTDYRLRISPALGHLQVPEVTRERIEVLVAELVRAGASRRMLMGTIASLRAILAAAVEWGRIVSNPAARLRLPAEEHHERQAVERVLDVDQYSRLIAACGTTRIETVIRAAAEAGLRRGEVIGLAWEDVDLPARRITVRRSVTQVNGKTARTTKGRRMRRVAISETFARRLADWFAEAVVTTGASATGPVWPGRDGGYLDAGSPGQALARTLARAGLIDDQGHPLVTFHGLRHGAASRMLGSGVPLIVVSRMLGHASPLVTSTVYAHLLSDSQLDDAAAVFDAPRTTLTVRETVRGGVEPPENPVG